LRTLALRTVCLTILLCVGNAHAHAHDTVIVQNAPPPQPYGPPYVSPYGPGYAPYRPPPVYLTRERRAGSIFGFGYRGLFTGALAGLGVSYFVARHHHDTFRDVGLSLGFGALAGAGAGLTLGLLDQVGVYSAYYVSRDLPLGVCFGAAVGALAGGLSALGHGQGRDILFGAAAGSLAGLGVGAIAGLIEGHTGRRGGPAYFAGRTQVSLAGMSDAPRSWGVRLAGAF
jgi:hypothetical protein